MAARRRRRAPAKKRPQRPPTPVAAQPGETLWVLDVPFAHRTEASAAGARWDAARRCTVYTGTDLPEPLQRWLPPEFSWAGWQASTVSGQWPNHPGNGSFQLRPHQIAAANQMVAAHRAGRPQWVLADELGLGKTLSAIAGVHELSIGPLNVLVVCPVSVIPAWRATLLRFGTGGHRWCIVSSDSLRNLLTMPNTALQAKTAKTRNRRQVDSGRSVVDWDVVIADESHRFKTVTSQRSKAFRRIVSDSDAFMVAMSATLGSSPLEIAYLAPVLGAVTGTHVADLEQFEQWAHDQGLGVTRGDYGRWSWDGDDADLERLRGMLFDPVAPDGIPAGLRRRPEDIAGWPTQDRILRPVELDVDGRTLYEKAWTAFRRELQLAQAGSDPSSGFAAALRFRQKASLLRVPAVVDTVTDLLEDGYQPAVSVQFLETLDAIAEQLEGRGVTVTVIEGQMVSADRETARKAFQSGDCQVIVHTLTEGINLHATEADANGVPRVSVIADPRPSVIQARQIEGRTHRDGCRAAALYMYAADTVEQVVVERLVGRLASMSTLHGDSTDDLDELLMELAA